MRIALNRGKVTQHKPDEQHKDAVKSSAMDKKSNTDVSTGNEQAQTQILNQNKASGPYDSQLW